jgi:peroxiredoxin
MDTDQAIRDRLTGQPLPALALSSTAGGTVDLATLPAGRSVIYAYPRTSEPGRPAPTGWDVIPGARGCTPQACAFRDHHRELAALGATVFGLSTQTTPYQQEMVQRLHLPFPVLSDKALRLTSALDLPSFEADGRRLTLILRDNRIEAVLYPVPAPEQSAGDVIAWLKARPL